MNARSQTLSVAGCRPIFGTVVVALVLGLAVVSPASVASQPIDAPLVSDRSKVTNSAATIRQGRFQIEGGAGFGVVDDVETAIFGELLLRIGLTEHWEFRFAPGSLTMIDPPGPGDRSGVSDAQVGGKLRLTDAVQGLPEAAILFEAIIPTGAGALGEQAWQPSATLVLGWEFADHWSIGANLGFGHLLDNGRRFDRAAASLALGVDLNDRLDGFVEVYGFSRERRGGPGAHYIDGGVIYLLNSEVQFDARLGFGLNEPDPEIFVGVGASARW